MEYLLIELFGGGALDWQMIGETNYDWGDILERTKCNFRDIEFCDFLSAIFELAKEDFCNMIRNFIEENKNDKELKKVVKKLVNFEEYEYDDLMWYENKNYLDNDLMITVSKDIAEILEEYLREEIDKIDDKIGFTYIQINVE